LLDSAGLKQVKKSMAIKTALIGASGKFGQSIIEANLKAKKLAFTQLIGSSRAHQVDPKLQLSYQTIDDLEPANVILDVSSHTLTTALLTFCIRHKLPLVIGSSAHTEEELQKIQEAALYIPIFMAANFSPVIHLFKKMVQLLAPHAKNKAYIDLIEKHRASKKDAPSATAKEIAQSFGLDTSCEIDEVPRKKDVLHIHPIRGDDHCIEHHLMVSFDHEELHLKHQAFSRQAYAETALLACELIVSKTSGLYGMDALI
jgi:4-hydroxy-tetrahydrodipicolinate reductase